jgi:hypothetical protein
MLPKLNELQPIGFQDGTSLAAAAASATAILLL